MRYDPQEAHKRVLKELSAAAVDAWLESGNKETFLLALRSASQQAEDAADAERARAKTWRELRRVVLANDRCHYCGEGATEVDHLMPYSRGGEDTLDNLVPACTSCNMEKLDFTVEEWRDYRLERGEEWPPEGQCVRVMRRVMATMNSDAVRPVVEADRV